MIPLMYDITDVMLFWSYIYQGTPEIGGMSSREAQQLVRGLAGVHMVGGDMVEVAPAYDPTSK
jgi:arginase family enzyme